MEEKQIENWEEEDFNSGEELFEHHKFVVDRGQEVVRIDKFLMDKIANTSRNKIQVAARNGSILVNQKEVKPNYKVKANDEISVVFPYPIREIELIPQDIPLNFEFEDEYLAVVHKPSEMVVHPGCGNYKDTLVNYQSEKLKH